MSDQNSSTTANQTFYRARFANKCTTNFLAKQLLPLQNKDKVPIVRLPSGFPRQPKTKLPSTPDRPKLYPILRPVPIFKVKPRRESSEGRDAPNADTLVSPYPVAGDGVLGPILEPEAGIEDMFVGIIGAGAAGLYTAMILQDLGIKYEVIEGSQRAGGRLRTHHFGPGRWNYFDVGAMRFPDIPIMWRVFDLIRNRLNLGGSLIKYIMTSPNQFLLYNRRRQQQQVIDNRPPSDDLFHDSAKNDGLVPKSYVDQGVNYWLDQCFGPFKARLVADWASGYELLMRYDQYSARAFMATAFNDPDTTGKIFLVKDAYPMVVIDWMERMNTGSGLFDMAFVEMVLDDLQFDWPNASGVKYGGDYAGWAKARPIDWHCLEGGSETLADRMVRSLEKPIQYNKRVTEIIPTDHEKPLTVFYDGNGSTEFSYVISTIPLPSLRFVDIDKCNPSYAQLEGMRGLRYDSSCKVGMKFRSRWWQDLQTGPIEGGQSKTDRAIRTTVFPSYGIDDDGADAVMIASYTWSQDAIRVGGLMHGGDSKAERFLVKNILKDLSLLHNVELETLEEELVDWYAFDWSTEPYTLGAFALFGPSQFSNIYPAFGQGAAGGRLLFAGEALSEQHAWVEGALISAFNAVDKMLVGAGREDLRDQLQERWDNNPYLTVQERQEVYGLNNLQEYLGALLSTLDLSELDRVVPPEQPN